MDFKNSIKIVNNTSIIEIKVTPNTSKNELFSIMDNWIFKIKLHATPENWKANKALISFISNQLWINKNNIKILSWQTSRNKLVKIDFYFLYNYIKP